MKIFTKWWVKPIKLSDKEAKILRICNLILSMPDVEIKPQEFGYLIRSKAMDYFLHVNSSGLAYTNHGLAIVKNYRDEFLELIKKTILTKTTAEIDEILDEMDRNEHELLDNMIFNLESYSYEI
jgi:hypothetical protein